MPLTKTQRKNYLSYCGLCCPYCESSGIEGVDGVEVNEGVATQLVKCNGCKKHWTDVYRLVDVKAD